MKAPVKRQKIVRLYKKTKIKHVLFVGRKTQDYKKCGRIEKSILRNTKGQVMKLHDYQNRIQKVNKNRSHMKA